MDYLLSPAGPLQAAADQILGDAAAAMLARLAAQSAAAAAAPATLALGGGGACAPSSPAPRSGGGGASCLPTALAALPGGGWTPGSAGWLDEIGAGALSDRPPAGQGLLLSPLKLAAPTPPPLAVLQQGPAVAWGSAAAAQCGPAGGGNGGAADSSAWSAGQDASFSAWAAPRRAAGRRGQGVASGGGGGGGGKGGGVGGGDGGATSPAVSPTYWAQRRMGEHWGPPMLPPVTGHAASQQQSGQPNPAAAAAAVRNRPDAAAAAAAEAVEAAAAAAARGAVVALDGGIGATPGRAAGNLVRLLAVDQACPERCALLARARACASSGGSRAPATTQPSVELRNQLHAFAAAIAAPRARARGGASGSGATVAAAAAAGAPPPPRVAAELDRAAAGVAQRRRRRHGAAATADEGTDEGFRGAFHNLAAARRDLLVAEARRRDPMLSGAELEAVTHECGVRARLQVQLELARQQQERRQQQRGKRDGGDGGGGAEAPQADTLDSGADALAAAHVCASCVDRGDNSDGGEAAAVEAARGTRRAWLMWRLQGELRLPSGAPLPAAPREQPAQPQEEEQPLGATQLLRQKLRQALLGVGAVELPAATQLAPPPPPPPPPQHQRLDAEAGGALEAAALARLQAADGRAAKEAALAAAVDELEAFLAAGGALPGVPARLMVADNGRGGGGDGLTAHKPLDAAAIERLTEQMRRGGDANEGSAGGGSDSSGGGGGGQRRKGAARGRGVDGANGGDQGDAAAGGRRPRGRARRSAAAGSCAGGPRGGAESPSRAGSRRSSSFGGGSGSCSNNSSGSEIEGSAGPEGDEADSGGASEGNDAEVDEFLARLRGAPGGAPPSDRCGGDGAGSGGEGSDGDVDGDREGDACDRRSITMDQLRAVFHMPRRDAARALGVGVTLVKRECRRRGVRRWPHRKLASVAALVDKVEAYVAERGPSGDARHVLGQLRAWLRRMLRDPNAPIDAAVKRLRQGVYKLEYKSKRRAAAKRRQQPGGEDLKGVGGT